MNIKPITHNPSANLVKYSAGASIFNEGSEGEEMYIVVEGEVLITLRGKTLTKLSAGEMFGEMSLLKSEPRCATALALTDCVLDPIDKEHFDSLIEASSSFSKYMINVLGERVRSTNEVIVS